VKDLYKLKKGNNVFCVCVSVLKEFEDFKELFKFCEE
jgi:hypothetical protein